MRGEEMDSSSSRSGDSDTSGGAMSWTAMPSAPDPGASPMTADGQQEDAQRQQPSLPSVATILKDHLLSNVSDENRKLREDNGRMEVVRESLTTVKIQFGDGPELVADLAKGSVIPDESFDDDDGPRELVANPFYVFPRDKLAGEILMLPLYESEISVPLSDVTTIEADRANQIVGAFLGVSGYHFHVVDDDPWLMLTLSEHCFIQGKIGGLSKEDLERFRDDEIGAEEIHEYIERGTGLQADNATFTPVGFHMDITPETLELLDLLRSMCGEDEDDAALKAQQSEYDLSRRAILDAIGCNETHVEILEENEVLKLESSGLKAMGLILGTIKIPRSSGEALTLHLKEGKVRERFLCLNSFSETIEARDLARVQPTLSGTPMHLTAPVVTPFADGHSWMDLRLTYHNNVEIYGYYDSSSVDLVDFPSSDARVIIDRVVLPLGLVQESLDALGIVWMPED